MKERYLMFSVKDTSWLSRFGITMNSRYVIEVFFSLVNFNKLVDMHI